MRRREFIAAAAGCGAGWLLGGCPALPGSFFTEPRGDHWLRLAHISDVHIVDAESPARVVLFEAYQSGSWRPQDAHACHVLDATVRAVNRRHRAGRPMGRGVDGLIATGDLTDNVQFNELRWFIDVLDGRQVTPDSGALDGPLRPCDPADNPCLPFQPQGLAKDVPWFACIGNHDDSAQGNFLIDRETGDPGAWYAPLSPMVADLVGFGAMTPPQSALQPTLDQSAAVLLASADPVVPGTYQLQLDALAPGAIPADPDRRYLSKHDFVGAFFDTISAPIGHGFDAAARFTGEPRYSVRIRADIPLRLITFDSAGPYAMPGVIAAEGVVTRRQFEQFIKPAVRAARAEDEFVLLASHHPSDAFTKTVPAPMVTPGEFTGWLTTQPHIVAHLCGHKHYHRVRRVEGRHPYIEIMTGSLIDYPQEGRMLDFYYDAPAGRFHVRSELFSHLETPTRLALQSHSRASADMLFDPSDPAHVEYVGAPPPRLEDFSVPVSL